MSKSYTIGRMDDNFKWTFIVTHSKEYARKLYDKWSKIYKGVSGF